jgi:hypothetical protein
MSNAHKGEVTFEASGKTYTFKLGTFAQAAIEAKTKQNIFKFFAQAQEAFGVADILTVFHAGLLRAHNLTEDEVADLIDELGMARVGEIMGEALNAAFAGIEAGTANPPAPRKANGPGLVKN